MSHFSFTPGSSPAIEIRVSSGRLDMVKSADDSITVDVSGRGAENIVVEQIGDTVAIREERNRFVDRAVSLRVAVPARTAADIAAASLHVNVRVALGRVNARTASGDLSFEDIASGELRSASGDVSLEHCEARCQISTASGDVRAEVLGGDAEITSASGDVHVRRADGRLEVKSSSGDISVGCCLGNAIEIISMSGDVDLGLPEGRQVEASIDSLSGDIRLPARRPASGVQKEVVRLRVKTVSGDIQVQKVEHVT